MLSLMRNSAKARSKHCLTKQKKYSTPDIKPSLIRLMSAKWRALVCCGINMNKTQQSMPRKNINGVAHLMFIGKIYLSHKKRRRSSKTKYMINTKPNTTILSL